MVDMVIQRVIEFLISIPTLPLWMALSAALPRDWSHVQIYFAITIILSLFGWTGLARVVRGKLLSMREEDFRHGGRAGRAPATRASSSSTCCPVHQLPDRQHHAGDPRHDPGRNQR